MSFRLDSLALENFRQFAQLELSLHPRLTVLSARNGGGKSSLLEAISTSVEPFVSAIQGDSISGIWPRDLRLIRSPGGGMEQAGTSSLHATGQIGGKPTEWSITRRGVGRGSRGFQPKELVELVARAEVLHLELEDYANGEAKAPELPILSVYGTHRLSDFPPVRAGKEPTALVTSRKRGYDDCLDPTVNYTAFAHWFKRLSYQEIEDSRKKKPPEHPAKPKLDAVRNAVTAMLETTGWRNLQWDFDAQDLRAEHPQLGLLPVSSLSDGIKGILALTADIAHRCVRLNPHHQEDAPKKTAGVVAIDEADLFLHPEWQQTVVANLQTAFPEIQFVLTTHSPQLLSTVPAECIRVLEVEDHGRGRCLTPGLQTRGTASAIVLSNVMDIDPIPRTPETLLLERYRALIEDGLASSTAATEIRRKLQEHFGQDHPTIIECDRLIRFQALKAKHTERVERSQ